RTNRFRLEPDLDFNVVLSNPRRDSRESTDVSAPRLDPQLSTAVVRIVSYSDLGLDPGEAAGQHAVFNFAKAHFYVTEDVHDYWQGNVIISVFRTFILSMGDGATINYRINNTLLSTDAEPPERSNLWPLQPGSEYAIPFPDYAANSLIRQGSNYDFVIAEGSI